MVGKLQEIPRLPVRQSTGYGSTSNPTLRKMPTERNIGRAIKGACECPRSALSEGITCRDYLFGNRFASDDRQ
jgi:hypothetical protein